MLSVRQFVMGRRLSPAVGRYFRESVDFPLQFARVGWVVYTRHDNVRVRQFFTRMSVTMATITTNLVPAAETIGTTHAVWFVIHIDVIVDAQGV